MPNKKIKILKNGPYQVSGNVPLKENIIEPGPDGISREWGTGKTYPGTDATYHLCRCGHSKNKPFCDGVHLKTKFNCEETAGHIPFDEAAALKIGAAVDLLDNESLCAVARFCDRGAQVWGLIEDSDKESVALAIDEACKCPTGRLVIVTKDGKRIEPELKKEIGAVYDPVKNCLGPLWVKGGIEIEGADGVKYEVRNRVTLCRCGQSSNMPFCDASHLVCPHMRVKGG